MEKVGLTPACMEFTLGGGGGGRKKLSETTNQQMQAVTKATEGKKTSPWNTKRPTGSGEFAV